MIDNMTTTYQSSNEADVIMTGNHTTFNNEENKRMTEMNQGKQLNYKLLTWDKHINIICYEKLIYNRKRLFYYMYYCHVLVQKQQKNILANQ